MDEHSRRKPLGRAAAAALCGAALVSGTLGAGSAAGARGDSEADVAQSGCVISSMRMYSHYSRRNREHYMIFRPAIRCTRNQAWKVTITIRRRRFGPDKTVASRQYHGTGSRSFIIGAGCKNGNDFNGNIWLNLKPRGPTIDDDRQNVEC